jgi:hypothetical protein
MDTYKGLMENIPNPQVFRWHKSFLEGREQVDGEPHAGRPYTSEMDDNVERVRSLEPVYRPSNSNTGFWHEKTLHVRRHFRSMSFWQTKHPCNSSSSYSPDLSPCGLFLFPRLKNHVKGRYFGTLENIQKSVTDEVKGIPTEAVQHG